MESIRPKYFCSHDDPALVNGLPGPPEEIKTSKLRSAISSNCRTSNTCSVTVKLTSHLNWSTNSRMQRMPSFDSPSYKSRIAIFILSGFRVPDKYNARRNFYSPLKKENSHPNECESLLNPSTLNLVRAIRMIFPTKVCPQLIKRLPICIVPIFGRHFEEDHRGVG